MKKLLLTAAILSLLIPASLFSEAPLTDEDVQDATISVLSLFGIIFMSSLSGTYPEGVTVDSDMEKGTTSIAFENFDVDAYVASMADMINQAPEEDRPSFDFSRLSGTIELNQGNNNSMVVDVNMQGGNVKTLMLHTTGEDLIALEANGENYNHLEEVFKQMQ
jgi:hypothetical protein